MRNPFSRRTFIASAATSIIPPAFARGEPTAGLLAMLSGGPQPPSAQAEASHGEAWKEAGVIDLKRSPYAKLKTVPISAVTIQEGFWSKRRRTNVDSSIPSMHDELMAHGRMDNFLRLEGKSPEPQKGPVYSDSDIYKWLEAVGFALQTDDRRSFAQHRDGMIRDVVAAQEPSGYLNTYYQDDRKSLRMNYDVQTTGHELYCIGHMLQGAIAYYRANGDRTLLDAGIRFIDGFLISELRAGANQKGIVSGHPGDRDGAGGTLPYHGRNATIWTSPATFCTATSAFRCARQQIVYMFCGIPFTSRTRLEGHAVRAMYACCGATDYYLETGDPAYWKTLNTLWDDLDRHQLYVTGGVGAREAGEAFGDAYELPNARAYGESCAAIGNMMWNWRMLAASGEAQLHRRDRARALQRHQLRHVAGRHDVLLSQSAGLRSYGRSNDHHDPDGQIRNPVVRHHLLPAQPGTDLRIAARLLLSDQRRRRLRPSLRQLGDELASARRKWAEITQKTNYPWSGQVRLSVSPATPAEFTVFLRIPGWSAKNTVKVNGTPVSDVRAGEYLAVRRTWSGGDVVEMEFDMTTHLLKANPAVTEDRGRVAFQRGPIVFCMEQPDQLDPASAGNLSGYVVHLDGATKANYDAKLLDGVMTLEHPGTIRLAAADPGLYFPASEAVETKDTPTTLKLIPYYAWANRGPAAMQVWIPYQQV